MITMIKIRARPIRASLSCARPILAIERRPASRVFRSARIVQAAPNWSKLNPYGEGHDRRGHAESSIDATQSLERGKRADDRCACAARERRRPDQPDYDDAQHLYGECRNA